MGAAARLPPLARRPGGAAAGAAAPARGVRGHAEWLTARAEHDRAAAQPRDLRSLCERMDLDLVDQQRRRGLRGAGRRARRPVRPARPAAGPGHRPARAAARPLPAAPGPARWTPAAGTRLRRGAQHAGAVRRRATSAGRRPASRPAGRARRRPTTPGPLPAASRPTTGTPAEAEPALARSEPTAVERASRAGPGAAAGHRRLGGGDPTSGARAGRGEVELALPQVPTVSREHARFTYASGQWWITNLGRNGLTINGVPLAGDRPLSTGDLIRWGRGRTRSSPGSRSAETGPRPRRAPAWRHSMTRDGDRRSRGSGREAMGPLYLWSAARGEWAAARPTRSPGWTGACSAATRTSPCTGRPLRGPALRAPPVGAVQPGHHPPGVPGPARRDETPAQRRGRAAAARHVLPVAPARYEALPSSSRRATGWSASAPGCCRCGWRRRPGRGARIRRPGAAKQPAHPGRGGTARDAAARPPGAARPGRTRWRGCAPTSSATAPPGWPWPSTTRSTSSAWPPRSRADDGRGHRPGPERRGRGLRLKKLLQGLIWNERGHARDLADFLLANALLTPADLDQARQAVAETSGAASATWPASACSTGPGRRSMHF